MRQTLQTLLGFDLPTAQKVLIASVVILALLILLGLFVRQIKGGRLRMRGQGGGRARQPRLGVVDTHDLDRQRQLVLIRRDNVEHLIMIGGASDVVVETNIMRGGSRANMALPAEVHAPERPVPVDPMQGLDSVRPEPVEEPRRVAPPMPPPMPPPLPVPPVAVAVPVPEAAPAPRVAPPLRPVQSQPEPTTASVAPVVAAGVALGVAAHAASQSSAPAAQAPSFARDHAPAPTASASELDDMTRQLEEALKRPFSAVRPANAPVVPEEMVRPAPVSMEGAGAAAPVAVTPPAPMARPVATPADVEAELEMALGLKPERVSAKPPAVPEPVVAPAFVAPEPPAPEPEPAAVVEPEPAAAAKLIEAGELFKSEPAANDEKPAGEAARDAEPEPAHQPEPVLRQEVEATEPEKQPEVAPEPAPIDPFSVDAIEAEFARLLGRDPKKP
jgi:hypothetical protein